MSFYQKQFHLDQGRGLTQAVKYLLIANISIFLIQMLFSRNGIPSDFGLRLSPYDISHKFAIWQLITYMFLHGGIWHLLFNMFALWMFGTEIERYWGASGFIKYYLLTGIGGGLFFYFFNINAPPQMVTIGASGAIYGLLVAFAIMFPDRYITLLLFFVLPITIRARYYVLIFASIELFLTVTPTSDGIAHLAHLGGAVLGFLYLRRDLLHQYFNKYRDQRQRKMWLEEQEFRRTNTKRERELREKHLAEKKLRQEEIDQLLDKINEIGYDNLTDNEKQRLREASQFLSDD